VESILCLDDLPTKLKRGRSAFKTQVYVYESITEIDVSQLVGHFNCEWLILDNITPQYSGDKKFQVAGIVYNHPTTGELCLREPHLRHRLASEIQTPDLAPAGLPTLKLFLDLYADDFGTYKNVYNATGGIYLVIGNLPQVSRQKLRNLFDLGLIPAGVSFENYIQPFIRELESLQRGRRFTIRGTAYWIVAGKCKCKYLCNVFCSFNSF
jgi:hypothetical protein